MDETPSPSPAAPADAATPTEAPLDFAKADFGSGSAPTCVSCNEQIASTYYEVNGKVACERCQTQLANHFRPVDFGMRLRGFGFGAAAAALGGAGWALITQLTGYEIGLVAIAVGWLVGQAVAFGTGRRGGWIMQLGAVGLTYLAVVSQYVAMVWSSIEGEASVLKAALSLGIGLAAPFLAGLENFLGIVIIAFGLYEAWKHAASVELQVTGPYDLASRKPSIA